MASCDEESLASKSVARVPIFQRHKQSAKKLDTEDARSDHSE